VEFKDIEAPEYESAEQARMDWSFASDPVYTDPKKGVLHNIAKAVASSYGHTITYDDAYQEASIIIASNPQHRRDREDRVDGIGLGALVNEVKLDVIDKIKRTAEKRTRWVSYEDAEVYFHQPKLGRRETLHPIDLREEEEPDEPERQTPVHYGPQPRGGERGLYDRRLVESLVFTIWDGASVYGLKNDQAPEPDMPKGYKNPKESNTLWAHLIDIRIAWEWAMKGGLTLDELRAVFLRYGCDWKLDQIGYNQGVNQSTAQRRAERGVGKLMAHLNGAEYIDGYDNDYIEEDAA
jgi:hypothetical protein